MKYCCKYSNHYVSQSGGGGIPIFYGRRTQAGHGLGNIFSSLGRVALPFVQSLMPHFKSAAKYLGKKALDTGMNIVGDVISGRDIKESATERLKDTGRSVLADVGSRLQSGRGRKKRKLTSKKKQAKKRRKIEKTILD